MTPRVRVAIQMLGTQGPVTAAAAFGSRAWRGLNGSWILAALAGLVLALPASAADDTGARLFFNHCAACHGDDGEGRGPLAASLRVTIPNLRTLARRNGGVFPTESVTAYVDGRTMPAVHGDRQMPIWGDVFRGARHDAATRTVRRRVAAVVDHVSTLQDR